MPTKYNPVFSTKTQAQFETGELYIPMIYILESTETPIPTYRKFSSTFQTDQGLYTKCVRCKHRSIPALSLQKVTPSSVSSSKKAWGDIARATQASVVCWMHRAQIARQVNLIQKASIFVLRRIPSEIRRKRSLGLVKQLRRRLYLPVVGCLTWKRWVLRFISPIRNRKFEIVGDAESYVSRWMIY